MNTHAALNRFFRRVWNDRRHALVPVAETAKGPGKRSPRPARRASLVALALAGLFASPALAVPPEPTSLPSGGQTVAGQAAIAQTGARMEITQTSARAAIDWQSFTIGAQAQVNVIQPSRSAVLMNRVLSADPSAIFGRLTANGQIFLSNPHGVLFGPSARVDVGGLVATSMSLGNDDFMAGRYRFTRDGATGSVVNQGELTAATQGYIALLAPEARNEGVINAQLGTVALAAGDAATLDFSGDRLLNLRIDPASLDVLVDNRHAILAPGGQVILSASAANTLMAAVLPSDQSAAQSLELQNGAPRLAAANVRNTGMIDVGQADGQGGQVRIDGTFVALGGAISADGQRGGAIQVAASQTLSLADSVSARSQGGQGGAIDYRAGQLIETAGSRSDASGAQGGTIRVLADGGAISSGRYLARGAGTTGGRIDFSADTVRLLSAHFDAGGVTQGGLVRIGGEFQGGKNLAANQADYDLFLGRWDNLLTLPHARKTFINDSSAIDVSAEVGAGGTAVVWSDSETTQLGHIDARGATHGGAVEISSADWLRHAGLTNVQIDNGALRLDPKNITIGDMATTSSWSYQAMIGKGYSTGANTLNTALDAGDNFGWSIALNSDNRLLAVGAASSADVNNSATSVGAVRLFSFSNANFGGGVLQAMIGKGYSGGKNLDVANLESGDHFGAAVALNATGDRLAVGAYGDAGNGNTATSAGAVYLFGFNDTQFSGGTQFALLGKGYSGGKNMDIGSLEASDNFGYSVALNAAGDRLAVGAYGDAGVGNAFSGAGAVRLFSFGDTKFGSGVLEATLGKGYSGGKDVDIATLEAGDTFGYSVALNGAGDRLAVGAFFDAGVGNTAAGAGAAYLMSFADTSFSSGAVQGILGKGYSGGKNLDIAGLEAGDFFGGALALNATGDRLAVGAWGDDGLGNTKTDAGAAYLFSFSDNNFSGAGLQATLGSGYVGGKNFDLSAMLDSSDGFGASLALNATGDHLAVGVFKDGGFGNSSINSGAVHFFTFGDTSFTGGSRAGTIGSGYYGGNNIDVAALQFGDLFGSSLALNAAGDRLAVGAPLTADQSGGISGYGAVRLFKFSDANFNGGSLQATLGKGFSGGNNVDVANLESGDLFGTAVAFNSSGTRLAVGAYGDSGATNADSSAGAVYLFGFGDADFTGGTQLGMLGKGYSGAQSLNLAGLDAGDRFGISLALNATGDRLAVGAYGDAGNGNANSQAGAVYLFSFADASFATPTQQAILGKGYSGGKDIDVGGLESNDQFGSAVALNAAGDRLAVGATLDAGLGNAVSDSGAVRLFSFSDTDFSGGAQQAIIGKGYSGGKNIDIALDVGDVFGSSVALNAAGDRLAVGAIGDAGSANGRAGAGAVYLFDFADGNFSSGSVQATLGYGYSGGKNVDMSKAGLEAGDKFGAAVAMNAVGNRLAVGAMEDAGATNTDTAVGAVYLLTGATDTGPAAGQNYSYADYADQSLTLKPADVVDLLNKGTALTLQANNDITIASPLLVTATGGAGKLTVQAGRTISFNANVTTGNADLLAVAGDTAADGAYRDAGASNLTIAGGVTLNVGTGTATLAAIGGNFVNNAGAIGVGGSGRYLIYAADPATSTEGFSGYNKHYNQAYSATAPSYAASGNWIMYSVAPTLTVTPTATTVEYGATPTIGAGYSGFIDGDTATDISGTASYAIGGANSSSGNPIVGVHNLAYSSGLSSNLGYQLIDSSVSLNELTVTAKPLSLTGIGAVDKTYDATLTATLSGAGAIAPISGDAVTLGGTGIGSFADKNVGIGKTVTIAGFSLSGADAGNYSIVQPTATATIAPADLSIGGVGADNKVYDATTTATLNGAPTVTPLSGDSVTVGGAGTGSFADKNVGIGKTVTIVGYSLSGADASNYNIVQPSATATIGAKPVSVSGISADNKTYDGTTIAGVSDAQATIAGLIAGDTVSIVSSGSFVDKNVGVGKTVTLSSSYSGADVGNYSITDQTATTADIVAKALTLSGLRADDKTYDGTTAATVASYGSLQGVIATDTVSLLAPSSIDSASSSDAHFESADVGSNKIVYVPGLTLAGADAANYRLSTPQTTQASILAASGSTGASGAVDAGQLSASTAAASSTTGATTGATADATIVAASAQGQTTATTLTISDSGVGGGESSGAASSADSTTASVATSSATVAQAATKPLVKTAGLSMTDMSAMIQARHEFRTETFRDALDILRKQPDQAQLGDCQSSGDTLCIPAARKDIDIAEPTPTVRKRIAVMFANAAYTGAIPALESPTKDAAVIGETLRSRFDYDVKIVDNATQADIVRALKTLAETTERDDSVLIFYAGHGYQMNDTRMGYWLPVDASNKSPAKWLSNSDIARFLDAIPAKQLMLVSDSCFSGTFTEQKLKDTQIRMKRDDVLRQRSVVAISSGGEEPVSDEGRDGHSIFAWSLIETLKNLPESTMAVDMHKSIKDSVMKEFPQEPQFGAIRSARHNEGGDYVMEPKTGK